MVGNANGNARNYSRDQNQDGYNASDDREYGENMNANDEEIPEEHGFYNENEDDE